MNIILPDIGTNFSGFANLTDTYKKITECVTGDDLTINMPNWFAANMCSPFGAILNLARYSEKVESITFKVDNKKVREILIKNTFLSQIGCQVKPLKDVYDSAITYRQFFPTDNYFFKNYIENDLMRRLPPMSDKLNKVFKNSIFETFENAVTHSKTKTIFVCGQGFYHRNTLDFSITDIGMGFYKNVTSLTGLCLTPVEAIEWAMYENNTTKNGLIPGGIGLKSIKEFIIHNKGKIQIASDYGYWELSDGDVKTRTFLNPFPGSVVNIVINTADTCSYNLQEELELDDIF